MSRVSNGCWLPVPDDSPFPVQNLPFGVVETPRGRHVGVPIGDRLLDLASAAAAGLVGTPAWFDAPSLNGFMAAGPATWSAVRTRLVELLTDAAYADAVRPHLVALDSVEPALPFEVADYVDFYSSRQHAQNLGRILRPGTQPLLPNWTSLPVGYHGRAGTVVVSGTPVRRPSGQYGTPGGVAFGPTAKLDFEAEVGLVVGVPSHRGERLGPAALTRHVFGLVLVNDWSARDIQAWEYRPLGPLLGKSFLTSVSPWVVPLEALAPVRVPPPVQDPPPLPHLRDDDPWCLDLRLEVRIGDAVVSRPAYRDVYWTPGQQLAHLVSNGSWLRTGDLLASGTISGDDPSTWGSLVELSRDGAEPLRLAGAGSRTFLQDGDTVAIEAAATLPDGTRLGFGAVRGTVVPAS